MSKEVKRYFVEGFDWDIIEDDLGQLVDWSAYETLLEENKLLKATQYGSGRMQELRAERDALREQLEDLRKDAIRLDWLNRQGQGEDPSQEDVRALIDKSMKDATP